MRHLTVALLVILNLTAWAESAERVRVLTYNIRQGLGPDDPSFGVELDVPFLDKHVSIGPWQPTVPGTPWQLDALADRIAQEKPDVVMLQEITPSCAVSLGVHQVKRIAERLGMYHHFGVAHESDKGSMWLTMGNAVLSRFPLSDKQVVILNNDEGPLNVRCVTIAKVAHPMVPGGLWAASTHLASKSQDLRMRQVPVLVEALARLEGTVVVAGDFNAQPGNEVLATVKSEMAARGHPLVDAFGAAGEGEGLSYPAQKPDRRIDYVLAEPPLVPVAARVLADAKGSDHLPLLTEFEVRTGAVAPAGDRRVSLLGLLGN